MSDFSANSLTAIPRLGVGLLYNPSLPDFIRSNLNLLDYVSVIPDMGHIDLGPDHRPRFVEIESWVTFLDWLSHNKPVIAHNIAMSIGSANIFEQEYLQQIANWHKRIQFVWHSDHLSFTQVRGVTAHDQNAGLAMPVPYDEDVLDMIVDRVQQVQQEIPLPFLIENNVYYIDIPEQDMPETVFLNRLSERTGCGLLLDLHNIYTNSVNHGFDALEFISDIDLSRVIEIHIAGGNEIGGMYTDSHAGPCPTPVWELLDAVVPKAPNLCGITFEFHESYYPELEEVGVRRELSRARGVWEKYH